MASLIQHYVIAEVHWYVNRFQRWSNVCFCRLPWQCSISRHDCFWSRESGFMCAPRSLLFLKNSGVESAQHNNISNNERDAHFREKNVLCILVWTIGALFVYIIYRVEKDDGGGYRTICGWMQCEERHTGLLISGHRPTHDAWESQAI